MPPSSGVERYMGEVDGIHGVELEQQTTVTEDKYQLTYLFESRLPADESTFIFGARRTAMKRT